MPGHGSIPPPGAHARCYRPGRTWKTPRAGGGEGVAVASVTTGAPAIQLRSSRAVHELRRMRPAGEQARHPLERERRRARRRARSCRTGARAAPATRRARRHRANAHDERSPPARGRRPRRRRRRRSRAARPARARNAAALPVELEARDVRRDAVAAEDVDDEQVDGAAQPAGQPRRAPRGRRRSAPGSTRRAAAAARRAPGRRARARARSPAAASPGGSPRRSGGA